MTTNKTNYTVPFIIITTLFFLWGFITVLVDSLVPRLREVFELSYFQAGLVQFAFFLAYFVFSIPAGLLLSKVGYKKGIVIGLSTMALGCLLFYPASSERIFSVFLLAYFTLAAGITILQVAANPYVAVLGSEQGAGSRLNLAQAFNSLGTAIAPIAGAAFLLSDKILNSQEIDMLTTVDRENYYISEAAAVQTPFLFFAGLIAALAVAFIFIKLPQLQETAKGGYSALLKKTSVWMGAAGIFVYVGAEVAIGSYLVNYFINLNLDQTIVENETMSGIASFFLNADLSAIDSKAIVGAFLFFYWTGAMVGRFIGSALMRFIPSHKVLISFTALAIAMIFISISTDGFVAMWSILAVGLFNSIMFPTIFTLTLNGLGELKPQASGVLCMAIVGGAIVPISFGALADSLGFALAFLLPMACYAYIMFFAFYKGRKIVVG
ncbi:sugar MFS transporter [Nonlabens ponticola]|uniref:Sugar MFS transporter n=1 Tax=Nonlabens ponticola TaxID=2496866 RepID=A0A3S9MUC7_9FLAO|nr:sugar MFS transporter [Nonlabens ponticola]AZQ42776.1 sugar MFS transporter [Nonlabens ponticola]